jgi:hypothetical protein
LYMDDQLTFDHQLKNARISIKFTLSGCGDTSRSSKCVLHSAVDSVDSLGFVNKIERIQFSGGSSKKLGCKSGANTDGGVAEQQGKKWFFDIECTGSSVVWRKPWVDIAKSFTASVA